jgi:phosphoglycolate phosphatase
MASLVIFDLDGTLIDSRRDLAESTNEMLASYGAPPLPIEAVTAMVGEGAAVLVERALAASGLDPRTPGALDRFRAIYDRRLVVHTRPYPGIVDVVRQAAVRSALAVLTNKPETPARRLLDAFDLTSSFRWVIGGDGAFARKPDPAGARFLLTAAGARPEATLLVGDSAVDLETARRAGVRPCLAAYGFGGIDPAAADGGVVVAGSPAAVGEAIARFLEAAARA